MQAWKWQPVERAILRAVALQVRLMTLDQIARIWFSNAPAPNESARDAVRRLEDAALLRRQIVEAHPLLPLEEPLLTWTPQDRFPSPEEFQDVSRIAIGRWELAERSVEVFLATRETCHLFGDFRSTSSTKPCEATHDLHVAEVFLCYSRRHAASSANWLGEAAFPKLGFEIRRMKDPDAFIVDADGSIQRVVEFAGKYNVEHLEALHHHCAGQGHDRIARSVQKAGGQLSRLYSPSGTDYEIW